MLKLNLQLFGGRGSAGSNAKASAESKAEAKTKVTESLAKRAETVREKSERSRIVREATAEKAKGERNWSPDVGTKVKNVSYDRAKNELYNAPVGTVITMDEHNSGDYVGEYTRTRTGWVGSQKYQGGGKPADVKTADGFAMQVKGKDIRVVKSGKKK